MRNASFVVHQVSTVRLRGEQPSREHKNCGSIRHHISAPTNAKGKLWFLKRFVYAQIKPTHKLLGKNVNQLHDAQPLIVKQAKNSNKHWDSVCDSRFHQSCLVRLVAAFLSICIRKDHILPNLCEMDLADEEGTASEDDA